MLEKLFLNLFSQMGITPEKARDTLAAVLNEVEQLKRDRDGFRNGSAAVTAEFRGRLANVENALDFLVAELTVARATVKANDSAILPILHINGTPHAE